MKPTGLKFPRQWMVLVFLFLLDVNYSSVEGKCSLEHCTNRTTCVVMKDQLSCKCASGFYGDHCDQDAEMRVVCGENYIEVRALQEFFHYYKAKLESLHLSNGACRANETTIDGKKYYFIRTAKENYSHCGGKPFEKNFTHVKYSLKLSSDPEVTGNIIRDSPISVEYSCTFPYSRTVSLDIVLVPFSNETLMRVDDLDATVKMLLYTDETYTNAIVSSPVIELRQKVYVEVVVAEPANFFRMLVSKCWATQYNYPNHTNGSHHILIQNGCAKDPTVSFNNEEETGANGQSSTVHFDFEMFRFTTEPDQLFLHCAVQLCEPNDNESCKPNCHSVAKREAVRADPAQGLLSYGPIKIREPQTSHSSVLATVVLPVAAVWTVGLFLVILVIVAKAGSRRLAQLDEPQYKGSGQL